MVCCIVLRITASDYHFGNFKLYCIVLQNKEYNTMLGLYGGEDLDVIYNIITPYIYIYKNPGF